ncbi:Ig-like domain-containing protein [Adhaeribacter aquaticus]|uniref:Ig-like domain-containing protein n=1 Tax=Adhaeribacter aquaticus TaxID=299567 RepID=UPI00047E0D20|nr:Ig-like domain-containing protein [Adhaeribacter aquaticus]
MIKQLLSFKTSIALAVCMVGFNSNGYSQVQLTTLDAPYQQSFDGMGVTGTSFAPHWVAVKASGSSTTVANGAILSMAVTNGGANSGTIYNVGITTDSDRAFGSLASGSIVPRFGASFVNNTGKTITSLELKGIMEQWRSGSSSAVNEVITFEYSLNATDLMAGSWTALPAFDLVEKLTGTTAAAAVVGNADANKTALTAAIEEINWPAGTTLWIRWTDKDDTGSDGIYAIDDFELIPHAGSTLPADANPPTLAAVNPFMPADNATGVALTSPLSITFNENVKAGSGSILLNNLTDGTSQSLPVDNASAVTFNGLTVTLTGAILSYDKDYAVKIPAGAITDLAGNVFTGFANNTTWNIATASAPVVDKGTSLTALDVAYSQNFDGMGTASGTTSFPANWFAVRAGGTGANGEALNPTTNNGSTTSGGVYNVGATGANDRALGVLASGSTIPAFGAYFTNNTGKIITSVDLKGVMEQWKSGSNNTVNETVKFEYSLNATSLNDGTWSQLADLDFNEILTSTTNAAAVDGNANKTNISGTINNIGWREGNTLWIRWTDSDVAGSDGMYALDDFELIPRAVEDVTAPTLAATNAFQPAAGDLQVDHENNFSITFSEIIEKGTGVIVIKNLTDNTTEQIALAAVLVNTNRATFSATLLPGKSYEVNIAAGVFEDLAGNKFAGIVSGAWTFTTAIPNPYAQNFNRCETNLPGGWMQYSSLGDTEVWACSTFGRTGNAVQVNGFNGGNKQNEDWLISPAFDLSTGFTYPVLSFWSRTRFAGESLKLMVSTNYSGTGDPANATWKEINGSFPVLNSDDWTLSENINLTKFKGSNVYIAFVYTSTTSSASRWTLDDFAITNSETEPATPVFFVSSLNPISNFDFGFVSGQAPTASKSFQFYALNLKTDLTVTAPAGFEVSKDNSTFSQTLSFTPDQAFDYNTVYVRFSNGSTTPSAFAGSVKFSSADFSTQKGYLTATTLNKDKTLDVVSWNIEWFGHTGLGPNNEALQMENAKKMILAQDAELYCVQEIANVAAFKELVKQLPGYKGFLSPFVSSPVGDNSQRVGFIYKTSAIDSVSARGLLQSPANPSNFWASGRLPYLFVADATVAGVKKQIHFVAVHAKANENGSAADALSAYNRRVNDLKVLKDSLDLYYSEANIMILGDFNDDVDFTVANVLPITASTYKAFIDDAANYRAVTKDLSEAGLRTYITFDNVIDHVVISDELYADYVANSAKVVIPFDLIENYAGTTSDHMPVATRFVLTPNVTFAAIAANTPEDAGTYNLTLNLTRASVKPQQIAVTVTPGTGITETDFDLPAGNIYNVTVPAGATTATLPLIIKDDNLVELDETLTFTISNATSSFGYSSAETFILTIQDNDASVVSFSAPSVTKNEDAGTYEVQLVLDQAPVTDQILTITAANSSTAQYGSDFTTMPAANAGNITLTIPAGATTAILVLQILDDNQVEPTEQLVLSLNSGNSKLAIGEVNTFKATITDNDKSVINFALNAAAISENAGSYQVTLTLDQAPVQTQYVTINLTNSSGAIYGTAKGQYTTNPAAANGKITLTIPAGKTSVSFVVVLNNNPQHEKDKTVAFSLAQLSAGLVSGGGSEFVLTVLDETNPDVKGPGSAAGLTVAPNPSHTNISLLFSDNAVYSATDLTLTLWNSQGQNLLVISGDLNSLVQQLNQKLTQVAKGMYILKVVNGSSFYQTRLIRD